jgi:hypothetical protein
MGARRSDFHFFHVPPISTFHGFRAASGSVQKGWLGLFLEVGGFVIRITRFNTRVSLNVHAGKPGYYMKDASLGRGEANFHVISTFARFFHVSRDSTVSATKHAGR